MDVTFLDAVLAVGATLRLTRLALVDSITEEVRDAVRRAGEAIAGGRGWLWADELVTCPHCAGFWVATAVVVTWLAWGDTAGWRAAAGVLTVSYIVGHSSARLDGGEED